MTAITLPGIVLMVERALRPGQCRPPAVGSCSAMRPDCRPVTWARQLRLPAVIAFATALLVACGKPPQKPPPAPLDVTTMIVTRGDVPVAAEYVAQTQSSQAVNIQARVSGFLDKRVYTEGSVVKAGQVLFRMDPKPFQAQVDGASGRVAAQPGSAAGGHRQPEPHQAAGATQCAVAEGPGRRRGAVRTGRGGRGAGRRRNSNRPSSTSPIR